jgi:hypothetical protein
MGHHLFLIRGIAKLPYGITDMYHLSQMDRQSGSGNGLDRLLSILQCEKMELYAFQTLCTL